MAFKELTNPAYSLGTKHIIFISDGDHWDAEPGHARARSSAAKITCTTVCITTHGQAEVQKMAARRQADRRPFVPHQGSHRAAGDLHQGKRGSSASRSFTTRNSRPELVVPQRARREGLDDLCRRSMASCGPHADRRRWSRCPIETPKIGEAQVPASWPTWQYGLGKAVAFTSDARTQTCARTRTSGTRTGPAPTCTPGSGSRQWTGRCAHRGPGKFSQLTTEQRDGKVRVLIEANDNDADKTPLTDVEAEGRSHVADVQGRGRPQG